MADDAAGDVAALGKLENLLHLGGADDGLLDHRIQHAGHGGHDLVDQLIDDRVELDLDSFPLGDIGDAVVDAGVEPKDDPLGSGSQEDIRLGDGPGR